MRNALFAAQQTPTAREVGQYLIGDSLVAGSDVVVDMIDDARKFEREVLHADVPQPAAEFVILAAPALDQFVVAVDANGVVAPEGHVAAARHFGLVAAEDRRCPGDADGVQPVGDILFPCVDVDRAVRQQSCRISGTQQHAAAADEASRTCDGDMIAHEIRMEDDIAVDLDDVGARGARDRLVADAADAESGVLLPYVDDRDGRLRAVTCDQLCGALVRTVVGDQYLGGRDRLP